MNLPYTFNDDNREIIFNRHDLPGPWINYLSNGTLHAFVSQAGGGMLWWRSPMTYRLTRYRMYNLPIDSPGFYIYIRHADGTIWSPAFRPCETPLDQWQSAHKPGSTTFRAEKNGLQAELTLFMAADTDALIWDLKLKNATGDEQKFDVFAYVELSQFMFTHEVNLGYYFKWMVRVEHDPDTDAIIYINHLEHQPFMDRSPLVYFAASEKIQSFSCDRDRFCGHYRSEQNPVAVERGSCDNSTLRGGEGCAALHLAQTLQPNEDKNINFFLGVTPGALKDLPGAMAKTSETLRMLKAKGSVQAQKDKNTQWWDDHLSVLQCVIPDPDAERQINIWNPLQSVNTARYSRAISSSASGIRGVGFRDSCQDMLAQAYRKPAWATDMLLYLASLQFEEGYPVHHAWPEEKKPPMLGMRSDNHIWLSYLAYAIICETGDLSLLEKTAPFLGKDLISPVGDESLWEHLMRGVEFTESHLGEHGLPLILVSDWNDHIGTFGTKGKGETIFVAQQHVYSLKLLSELARLRSDNATAERLDHYRFKQLATLQQYAWDGQWWLRGFDDEGQPIGTNTSEYGRIWLNTQSWAVISQAGDMKQLVQGMDAVRSHLDSEIGIQINAPGFPTWPDVQKPAVKGLPPGCAENAGIFCQANAWAIMAEAMLGRADIAWKYYRQLIPHVALQKIGLDTYQAEAYAYTSTIFSKENIRCGWANITQVTGTAAWMDVVATQYLLGIRPQPAGLLIDPCIPEDWEKFTVRRRFRGCDLSIEIENPERVQKGVKAIFFDGKSIDISNGAMIRADLLNGCKKAQVNVIMG